MRGTPTAQPDTPRDQGDRLIRALLDELDECSAPAAAEARLGSLGGALDDLSRTPDRGPRGRPAERIAATVTAAGGRRPDRAGSPRVRRRGDG